MKENAPSAERNRHDILPVLQMVLPEEGVVLEIASGTGQHAAHFAPHFAGLCWQPSEKRTERLGSIRAWAAEAEGARILKPIELDVEAEPWPIERADAIVNINMWHISPWSTTQALLRGARQILSPGAPLLYYGAFLREDRVTAPSNLEFDRSLRERDPAWGVRRLEDVRALVERVGLGFERILDMPNNNYALILRQPAP